MIVRQISEKGVIGVMKSLNKIETLIKSLILNYYLNFKASDKSIHLEGQTTIVSYWTFFYIKRSLSQAIYFFNLQNLLS